MKCYRKKEMYGNPTHEVVVFDELPFDSQGRRPALEQMPGRNGSTLWLRVDATYPDHTWEDITQ